MAKSIGGGRKYEHKGVVVRDFGWGKKKWQGWVINRFGVEFWICRSMSKYLKPKVQALWNYAICECMD